MSIVINETPWLWNGTPAMRRSTECIVLHHAGADCSAAVIHAWHQNRGWCGIGYHYYVRKDGSVWRGRDENAVGAHCIGKNFSSLGVCCEGNFEHDIMPPCQRAALAELIEDIRSRLGSIPLYGHREWDATACPGRNFPLRKGEIALFDDISGHWSEQDVMLCARRGLMEGYGDGTFRPDEPVKRGELARVLARLAENNTAEGERDK